MNMEFKESDKLKAPKNKKKNVFKKKRHAVDIDETKMKQNFFNTSKKDLDNSLSFPKDEHEMKNSKITKKNNHFKKNKVQKDNSEMVFERNEESQGKKIKRKSEDGESSPSKKMKLHNLKFKERKLIRKQKKKVSFDVVKLLKTHWEDLRREDCSPEKKSQLLNQICDLIKERVKKFAFAHDTVRILECVLAEGSEEHRTLIFEEIKGDIVNLSKSKYGKFLVMKILRYGTKKQKEAVMAAFNGVVTRLMKHTEAAEVVETAFNECANALQRFQMIQEFYGSNYRLFKESNIHNLAELIEKKPETKESLMNSMKEELMKVLEKSVVKHSLIHHVLLQFFLNCDPSARSEVIESLREVVPEILHTKDGSRVAMHCIWHGNQKDRKAIIKKMKTFVKKIAMEEHGHMVLLALFDCVDDTTLIEKLIIKELQESLLEVAQNVHGKKVLVYLLNPRDPHFFHPDIINILKNGDNNATSKKDPERRREELKKAIAQPLTQLIVDNIADLYKNNAFCLFTVTILKHTVGRKEEAFESIAKLVSEPYTSENKNVHIIENGGSFFMLKQLILNDSIEKTDGQNSNSVTFSEVLVNTVPDGIMKTWFYCNRGAFLLVKATKENSYSLQHMKHMFLSSNNGLFDCAANCYACLRQLLHKLHNLFLLETEIPAVVNRVRNELMGCHKQLDKFNFKGAELLVKKLRKLSVNTS